MPTSTMPVSRARRLMVSPACCWPYQDMGSRMTWLKISRRMPSSARSTRMPTVYSCQNLKMPPSVVTTSRPAITQASMRKRVSRSRPTGKLAGDPQRDRAVYLGLVRHDLKRLDFFALGLDDLQFGGLALRQGRRDRQQLVVRAVAAVDLDDPVALADLDLFQGAGFVLVDLDVLDLDAGLAAGQGGTGGQAGLGAVFEDGHVNDDLGAEAIFGGDAVEPVGQRLVLVEHHLQQRQDGGNAHGVEDGHAEDGDQYHRQAALLRPDVTQCPAKVR